MTFGERWDGSRWSLERGRTLGDLAAVSCVSSHRCVAVGSYVDQLGSAATATSAVAELWTGNRWRVRRVATSKSWADTSLTSVSCSSKDACTTVGSFDIGSGCHFDGEPCATQALAERLEYQRLVG